MDIVINGAQKKGIMGEGTSKSFSLGDKPLELLQLIEIARCYKPCYPENDC